MPAVERLILVAVPLAPPLPQRIRPPGPNDAVQNRLLVARWQSTRGWCPAPRLRQLRLPRQRACSRSMRGTPATGCKHKAWSAATASAVVPPAPELLATLSAWAVDVPVHPALRTVTSKV